MVNSIKGLTRIKKTCVHWSVMSSVVLDYAFCSKNTQCHVSRVFCFKSKLMIMCNEVDL